MTTHPALIDFVRRERCRLFIPDVPHEILSLVGLDDETLTRWAQSPDCVATLPHASPNVFHPRTRVGWFAGRLQQKSADTHHIRAVLTHINFSDLGWRPYAWWYLDPAGMVRVHRLFTRNKKRKHVVVSSRAAMTASPADMTGTDAEAARAAIWGADLAISFMLIGAVIERAAGMAAAGRVTYFPLSLLVSFAQHQAAGPEPSDLTAWCSGLLHQAEGRRINADGLLEPCDPHDADVLDNASNQALLSMLGAPTLPGGTKMLGYWSGVDDVIRGLEPCAPPGCLAPQVALVPEFDLPAHIRPSDGVREQLDVRGIPYSQGMAVTEHGAFAAQFNPFDTLSHQHDKEV